MPGDNLMAHVKTQEAYELALRRNELYNAIQIVESCGAHPLLTDAVVKLGERMNMLRADLRAAIDALVAK